MERIKIEVSVRDRIGKEGAKKFRFAGFVPGIAYGQGENIALNVSTPNLKILKGIHFSGNTLIDVAVEGKKAEDFNALIRSVQYHPLTEKVIHLDFLKVNLNEKIRARVPIALHGEPKSIKDGAVIEQILRELEVEALPLDIPGTIEIDIAGLNVGDSIHVSHVHVSDKVRITAGAQETIVTLVAHTAEEVAAEPVDGAPTGPEVIKEKKEEAAAEGADPKKEAPKKEAPKKEAAKDEKKK